MSVKLQKEQIRLWEVMCSPYYQTTVEGDVIVPDVKPDIQKILQVDNSVVINQKNVQTDKIYIQGTVKLNILYIPEGFEASTVRAISSAQEFNHTIDLKGAKPGMELWVDAEIESAEHTTVNSRKLNVRSKIGLSARLSDIKEMEIATGIEEGEEIELRGSSMMLYNPRVDAMRNIIVRERLEVPAGKPAICEVLKFSAKPHSTELSLLENKACIKGELKICTLYCGEGSDTAPEVMEHTIPFDEILEIEGLCEGMNREIDYCIKDYHFEICQDNDGDNRILSCEFIIEAEVRAFETLECKAIKDAYGIKSPIKLEKKSYCIEKMIGSTANQITINEAVNIPDYLPEINKLCDCNAVPTIENVSIGENTATVSGYTTCSFLYMSDDAASPISGFAHILPFSHCFEIPGISPDAVCDARAEVEHISCTINGGKSLQVRAIVSIGIKAVKPECVELVSEITYENEPLPKLPSMTIYFVQEGDTLWDISKKYRTPCEAITAVNGEESEIMKPGKCIYIFR